MFFMVAQVNGYDERKLREAYKSGIGAVEIRSLQGKHWATPYLAEEETKNETN